MHLIYGAFLRTRSRKTGIFHAKQISNSEPDSKGWTNFFSASFCDRESDEKSTVEDNALQPLSFQVGERTDAKLN